MFCNGCGAPLSPGQQFCARCGKELLGPVESVQVHRGRVREHIRLLAILWLAYAALEVVGGLILEIVSNTIFMRGPRIDGPPWTGSFMHVLMAFLGVFVLAKAALGFTTAWGLMQRAPWARILALILSFLAMFNVPFGTALGIYTLWVFLPMESEQQYEEQVRSVNVA
jgi:zinc-ribbon domain